MRLVSVNVSPGVVVQWRGEPVETGIFKSPVEARVMTRRMNIDGDRQSDLKVHGGEFKAVYAYSLEHYGWWRAQLGRDLPLGMFGENLTIEGFDENAVCVGDRFRVGAAVLEAVQPRLPCFKLAVRFGDPEIVKRFAESGRWGVYFRVLEEGEIGPGDEVSCIHRDAEHFPVPELARLYFARDKDAAAVSRALRVAALPPEWREDLDKP